MKSSFFEVLPFFQPRQVGDLSKGMAEADHKIISAEVVQHSICLFSSRFQVFFSRVSSL